MRFGKYQPALNDFNACLRLGAQDEFLLTARGELLRILGKNRSALRDFNQILQLNPLNAIALSGRGDLYRQNSHYHNALIDLNQSLSIEPNSAFALFARAMVHMEEDRFNAALADCNKAIELSSANYHFYQLRGEIFNAIQNPTNALENFTQALTLNPKALDVWVLRGLLHSRQQRYTSACEDFTRAIKINPKETLALQHRGEILRQQGDFTGALADLNTALRWVPQNAFALRSRGEVKRQQGLCQQAILDLDRSLAIEPDNMFALTARAEAHFQNNDLYTALADCNQAELVSDTNLDVFIIRGKILVKLQEKGGEIRVKLQLQERAIRNCNRLLELSPYHAFALSQLGNLYRQKGKFEQALNVLNRALAIQDDDVGTLIWRSKTHLALTDESAALTDLDSVLRLDPANKKAQSLRNAIIRNQGTFSSVTEWGTYTHQREGSDVIIDGAQYQSMEEQPSAGVCGYTRFFSNVRLSTQLVVKTSLKYQSSHQIYQNYRSEFAVWNSMYPEKPAMWFDSEGVDFRMVLPRLPGQMLADIFASTTELTQTQYLKIWLAVALALEKLHNLGWVHLDFKVDNVLLNNITSENIQAYLIDFGHTKRLGTAHPGYASHQRQGCMHLAPELFATPPPLVTTALDVYSFVSEMRYYHQFSSGSDLAALLEKGESDDATTRPCLQDFIAALIHLTEPAAQRGLLQPI